MPVVGYVAWVLPLVIFFVEKQSGLVRFHSMQAFVLNLIGSVINICVAIIFGILTAIFSLIKIGFIASIISALVSVAVGVAILVFAILAMIGAYQYNEYEIPVVSSIARWAIAQAESKMNK